MENNSCLVINERGVIVSEGFRTKKYFGKVSLYITGDVYNSSMKKVSDLDMLISLTKGIGNLRNYQGDFAGVFIDKNKAYIFSDRMCIRKIYYSANKSGYYIATRMAECARKAGITEISDEAIAELIFEKAIISHTTWYKGVRALSVGEYAICTIDEPGTISNLFYDASIFQEPLDISAEEYATILAGALEKSVLDMCKCVGKNKIGLFFSAGWDSRLIASILKKNNFNAKSIVIETDLGWDEVSFAKEINSSYYHFDLEGIWQPENYYVDAIDKCIEAMEYTMCGHLWFHNVLIPAMNNKCTYFTGLVGGNMLKACCEKTPNMSPFYGEESDSARIEAYCARRIVKIPFIEKEFYEYLCECYRKIMSKELKPFFETKNGGFGWYTVNRTSSQIMRIVDLMRPTISTVHPFCSNDFLNVSLVPPLNVQGAELYEKIYNIIDEKAWKIPSSNNAPEYKKEHAILFKKYNKKTFDYMKKEIENGVLAANGLIKVDALKDFVLKNKPERVLRILGSIYTWDKKLRV